MAVAAGPRSFHGSLGSSGNSLGFSYSNPSYSSGYHASTPHGTVASVQGVHLLPAGPVSSYSEGITLPVSVGRNGSPSVSSTAYNNCYRQDRSKPAYVNPHLNDSSFDVQGKRPFHGQSLPQRHNGNVGIALTHSSSGRPSKQGWIPDGICLDHQRGDCRFENCRWIHATKTTAVPSSYDVSDLFIA